MSQNNSGILQNSNAQIAKGSQVMKSVQATKAAQSTKGVVHATKSVAQIAQEVEPSTKAEQSLKSAQSTKGLAQSEKDVVLTALVDPPVKSKKLGIFPKISLKKEQDEVKTDVFTNDVDETKSEDTKKIDELFEKKKMEQEHIETLAAQHETKKKNWIERLLDPLKSRFEARRQRGLQISEDSQTLSENVRTLSEDVKISSEDGRKSSHDVKISSQKNFDALQVVEKPNIKAEEKLSSQEQKDLVEAEKLFQQGLASIRDLIAPSSVEIFSDRLTIDGIHSMSFYVFAYPRYLEANWLSPVINFDVSMDISQFIYPMDSAKIMRILRKKVAQMGASIRIQQEKGIVRDPALETAYEDAEELRTKLQRGEERFFQFALYFTIYHEDEKQLQKISKQLEGLLGGKLVLTKRAYIQAEHAFNATLPICLDELEVLRNMNTSPLSSTFPFSSSDLTSNEGVLYGLNRHNDSLIIFDRFSLENANSVVFAKSGAGKSYAVKLEILRTLMLGTDIIVIDPENEYEALTETVGGSYLRVSLNSDRRINPFDLPSSLMDEEPKPGDLLRSNIISLNGLMKLMLGDMTTAEEALLDKALMDTYSLKGITMDVVDPTQFEIPTMEDFYDVLSGMEGALNLAQRLQKYTRGTFAGIFNKPTNVDLKTGLMVFCIRDLEDILRPIAMYIILNYIWNRVRSELKRRILVIDEAWTMMQHEDSARFLYGLVKRSRKYYLGISTITQDVEDFVRSDFGKPIITNSSIQLLLKQSASAIEPLAKIFNLTEGEKYLLLNSGVGQGLFFAGTKHVAIQVIASYSEDKLVTTNPEELLRMRAGQKDFKA